MNFRQWLEIVEPYNPSGVRKSNIVKDKGTNRAKEAIQFRWKTKLGNVVKLHFDYDGPNAYTVVFYVNGTLFDNAAVNQNNGRDPEILAGIFYLLKEKANQLKADKLSFRGQDSESDTKTIRNIDPNQYKELALKELNAFSQVINNHQVQMIPPTQSKIDLYKRLNRDDPQPMPDFNKPLWLKWLQNIHNEIKMGNRITNFIDQLKTGMGVSDFKNINVNLKSLIETLTNFDNAVISNSPEGWQRTKNRRTIIYTKLVNRYMSQDWNIEINGNWFYLTRRTD